MEDIRLAALSAANIIDTPPDPKFDAITDLIRDFCDVPVALVSLVESDRQWFKSVKGLDICETPIEQSICAHAILQEDLFIISDTWEDERTVNNPLCRIDFMAGKPFRFYAGMPLNSPNGQPLGSLCVLDYKPRELDEKQKRLLRVMGEQVETLIELNQHITNQEILHNEMDHRVKNSLQSVLSMIRLYSSRADKDKALGPSGREAFKAVQRRVESIALLHEELHQAETSGNINLKTYLEKIVKLLQTSAPSNVLLKGSFEKMSVTSHEATAIAVIVSEFSANSIKHAFPDNRDGIVTFTVETPSEGGLRLLCQDNGVGIDEEIRETGENKVDGLGLRLMEASASQVEGVMERGPIESGYQLELIIPPDVPSDSE